MTFCTAKFALLFGLVLVTAQYGSAAPSPAPSPSPAPAAEPCGSSCCSGNLGNYFFGGNCKGGYGGYGGPGCGLNLGCGSLGYCCYPVCGCLGYNGYGNGAYGNGGYGNGGYGNGCYGNGGCGNCYGNGFYGNGYSCCLPLAFC